MSHGWKSYLIVFGIALAAVAASNKIKFINNLTGTQPQL